MVTFWKSEFPLIWFVGAIVTPAGLGNNVVDDFNEPSGRHYKIYYDDRQYSKNLAESSIYSV
jgi:hypothetical protein